MVGCLRIQFMGEAPDVGGAPFLAPTRRPEDSAETRGLHLLGSLKGDAAVSALGWRTATKTSLEFPPMQNEIMKESSRRYGLVVRLPPWRDDDAYCSDGNSKDWNWLWELTSAEH